MEEERTSPQTFITQLSYKRAVSRLRRRWLDNIVDDARVLGFMRTYIEQTKDRIEGFQAWCAQLVCLSDRHN